MSAREGGGELSKSGHGGEGGVKQNWTSTFGSNLILVFNFKVKLNSGNMAAINSYDSSRLSQLREQYSMSGAVYWKSYLVHLWIFRTGLNNSLKFASDQHDSYQDIHLSFILDEFAAKILLWKPVSGQNAIKRARTKCQKMKNRTNAIEYVTKMK